MTTAVTASPAEDYARVLTALLRALVNKPDEVEYSASVLPGRINWGFNCDVNDMGKVVGAGGVHLRALRLITEMAGEVAREQWWLDQPKEPKGERDPINRMSPKAKKNHSPDADLAMLSAVVDTVTGFDIWAQASQKEPNAFVFTLGPEVHSERLALTETRDAIYSASQIGREPMNLLTALQLLMRAIGARQGVRYKVEVA